MVAFILRRFFSMFVVLFCVITITFVLMHFAPGGPFTKERQIPPAILKQIMARYNLDGPLWEQFTTYLGVRKNNQGQYRGLLQGDLQVSTKYRDRSVRDLLAQTLPISATLGLAAFLLASLGGIWLGSIAAVRQHQPTDTAAMLGALFLISVPAFVTGPVLILLLAIKVPIFPVGGWNNWASLILPAITLAGPYIAYTARLMRTSMLEVLHQDFVRTARAKGLADGSVVYRHALKVAILPVVSFLGPLAANLLTGSIVVETVFNIPGAGPFFINSILGKDYFLAQGVIIVYCVLLVLLNLLVDIAYTWLDRRILLA
jgi:oligopeptide transport system permease protein